VRKEAFTHTRSKARRREANFASPMVSEARRGEVCLASPRACVYGVASTSGATAIESYKNGGEMNIHYNVLCSDWLSLASIALA